MHHEHSGPRLVDRREYLRLTGGLAAAGAVGLAGCTADDQRGGDGPDATGYLATEVTDQPTDIDDFESCVVTIEGIWLGPRTDGTEEDEEGDDDGDGDGGDDGDENETGNDDEDGNDEDGNETDAGDGGTNETESGESTSQAVASGTQPDHAGQGDDETTPGSGGQDGEADDADGGASDEDADDETGDGDDEDDDGEEGNDDGEDGSGGRTYLAFDEPQEADLVELQDDSTQLIDDREVTVGTYRFLQLDVSDVDGVLTDGSEATVETPGNAALKFQESFDVREDTRTTFTADFAPVRRGSGEYLIRPVATGTTVSYESAGDGE